MTFSSELEYCNFVMEQPSGSPGGSPQAGGVVDGAELARKMMMGTERCQCSHEDGCTCIGRVESC